jgi:signal transduction histidine kinase
VRARLPSLLRQTCPPLTVGVWVGAACVVLETVLLYPLRQVAPARSLDVVYLLGVLVIATVWGLWPGLATAVASSLAYNYFHLPPLHTWTHFGSAQWVRIAVFLNAALLVGFVADLARSRAMEAEEHRRSADLAADLAHLLLRAENLRSALPTAAYRLAQALNLPYAAIELQVIAADERRAAFPLCDGAAQIATLLVPPGLPEPTLRRLREQVVPSLQALLSAAGDREAISNALQASRDELRRIADEQAALRRVATLVASGAQPSEVFNAVASEMGHILGTRYTLMIRYESDGTMTVVGNWTDPKGLESFLPGAAHLVSGSRLLLEEGTASELVWRTGKPARINNYEGPGERVTQARELGFGPSVGCPLVVEGHLWGAVVAFSQADETHPEDTEGHMRDFTELVATAIANAESCAELIASRARVVAAADDTRRRIERDLHDGTQQRLVTLGLELRAAEATAPFELKSHLSHTIHGLTGVIEDLHEVSRGLHPAILSKGGLGPALKMLARRSAVPVELRVCADRRLAEHVEVAVYYIVSEALTNVAKHAHASIVHIDLTMQDTILLSIRDDGIGGADPGHGSGLIGLKDRVAVLGGNIEIASRAGKGTSLLITIPIGDA